MADVDSTKERLLVAAGALFAERGFHGTTARDIAERAGVNLAAGNYHYGSKKALYLEVLRGRFARVRTLLSDHDAMKSEAELARLSRRELAALLRRHIQVVLDMLIGSPETPYGALLQREMTDPSEALPVIVEEFMLPMKRLMERIVAHLAPALGPAELDRCVHSVFGQVIAYRFAMPALLLMLGRETYPRGFAAEVADHIVEFSRGGMERLARRRRRPARTGGRRPAGASPSKSR